MGDARMTSPAQPRIWGLVALTGILVLAVPLGLPAPTPSFGADPVTITMARNADMLTFDPAATEDDPSIFVELQVYDRLVKLAASNTGVEPELATAWTVAPDGLTATFTLRPGVKFSDGSPLTAEDVVFSLTRAIDQKGSWGFLFSPVKSVTKVDDKTVRLNMSEPFAPLLPALSTFAASIYSKANFEKWGKDAGQHPLGTGAFMLDSWQKGSQLALAKNPNYWQSGKPKVDRIVIRVVGDDNSAGPAAPVRPGGHHRLRAPEPGPAADERGAEDPEGGRDRDPAVHAQRDRQAPGRGERPLRDGARDRPGRGREEPLLRTGDRGAVPAAEQHALLRRERRPRHATTSPRRRRSSQRAPCPTGSP